MALLSEFPIAGPAGPAGPVGPMGPVGPVGPVGPSGDGSGDMVAAVYDPTGQRRDVFADLSNKADKSPPAWIDMPMTGDYTLTDNDKLQFGLNGAGETCICGLFKTPSTTEMSEQFATLPEGFRPKMKQIWLTAISSSTNEVFPVRVFPSTGYMFVWLAKFSPSDTIVIPMQSFSAGR